MSLQKTYRAIQVEKAIKQMRRSPASILVEAMQHDNIVQLELAILMADSASEFASVLGVSERTANRRVKDFGYEGITDFKNKTNLKYK